MKLTDVIRKPLITEKTTVMREDSQTLVFRVAMDANKIDIRRAVEQLLGAKVASVRTALAHGKEKRQGRFMTCAAIARSGSAASAREWSTNEPPQGSVFAGSCAGAQEGVRL